MSEFKAVYGLRAWLYEVMIFNWTLSAIDEEMELTRITTMLEF